MAADAEAGDVSAASDSLRLQPQHAGGPANSALDSPRLRDAAAAAVRTVCVVRSTHHRRMGHHAHAGQSAHKTVSVQHVTDILELTHSKNFLKMSNLETSLLLLKIRTFTIVYNVFLILA